MGLSLDLGSSLGKPTLELGESPLEQLEPATYLAGRLLPSASKLGAGLLAAARDPRPRLLSPPGQLVTGLVALADDVVDQLGRSLARARRRARGRPHRPLDRRADGVGDAVGGGLVSCPACGLGCVAHRLHQHNPPTLTAHLRPTAPIAPDVLLPGDPGLALALGQQLLGKPLMANHSHGLWGYSGSTATGLELTIQSSGIGGAERRGGARRAGRARRPARARIGTAVALDPGLRPGDTVVVGAALGDDGASRGARRAGPAARPGADRALLRGGGRRPVTVASSDLLDDPAPPAGAAPGATPAPRSPTSNPPPSSRSAPREAWPRARPWWSPNRPTARRADEALLGDALLSWDAPAQTPSRRPPKRLRDRRRRPGRLP